MHRTCIIVISVTIGCLLVAGIAPAKQSMVSPKLPGVLVSSPAGLAFGSVFHRGDKIECEISISTTKRSGLPGLRVRVFLPGMKILKLYPVPSVKGVRPPTKQLAAGGAIWTFRPVSRDFGDTFDFLVQAKGPVGRQLADKLVVTLSSGKSATYVLDSYRIIG